MQSADVKDIQKARTVDDFLRGSDKNVGQLIPLSSTKFGYYESMRYFQFQEVLVVNIIILFLRHLYCFLITYCCLIFASISECLLLFLPISLYCLLLFDLPIVFLVPIVVSYHCFLIEYCLFLTIVF